MSFIQTIHRLYERSPICEYRKRMMARKIARYLYSTGREDYREVADYLTEHDELTLLPYRFRDKYATMQVDSYVDEEGYPYVLHNGKKLFGPREWSPERMASYYIGLLIEQDAESPHRYLRDDVVLTADDVVADIGAAEGIFALDVIDRVRKVYLFECDKMWTVPLQKTFAPWGGYLRADREICVG